MLSDLIRLRPRMWQKCLPQNDDANLLSLRGMIDPHIDRRLHLECAFCEWFKKRFDGGKGNEADEVVYKHHLKVVHRLEASGYDSRFL